ncbi:MAG TPA: hypothetical protein VFN26_19815 [Candidatus Acidoferrum sp.]|nr:hypothetical protein [Candidatus Acidoferrum sp.]
MTSSFATIAGLISTPSRYFALQDPCPDVCVVGLVALIPLALAAVVTASVLLTNWILSSPRDSNRSS